MNYEDSMKLIDFLINRMRPLRWYLLPNVTWDKMRKWASMLGYKGEL